MVHQVPSRTRPPIEASPRAHKAMPSIAISYAAVNSPCVDTRHQDRKEKTTRATDGCLPACCSTGGSSSPVCSTSSPPGTPALQVLGSLRESEPDGNLSPWSSSFSTEQSLTARRLPLSLPEHPQWTWNGLKLHPGAWSMFPSRSWQEQLLSQAAAAAATAAPHQVNLAIGHVASNLRSPNLPVHGPAFNALVAASVPQLPQGPLPNVPAPVAVAVAVALRWMPSPCPRGCVLPWGPPHRAAHTPFATHCHTCGSCLTTTTAPAATQRMAYRALAPAGRSPSPVGLQRCIQQPKSGFAQLGSSGVAPVRSTPSIVVDTRRGLPLQAVVRPSVPSRSRGSCGTLIEQPVPSQCSIPQTRRITKVRCRGASVKPATSDQAVPVSIERRPSPRRQPAEETASAHAAASETHAAQTAAIAAAAAAAAEPLDALIERVARLKAQARKHTEDSTAASEFSTGASIAGVEVQDKQQEQLLQAGQLSPTRLTSEGFGASEGSMGASDFGSFRFGTSKVLVIATGTPDERPTDDKEDGQHVVFQQINPLLGLEASKDAIGKHEFSGASTDNTAETSPEIQAGSTSEMFSSMTMLQDELETTVASLPSQQLSQKDVEMFQQPVSLLQPGQAHDMMALETSPETQAGSTSEMFSSMTTLQDDLETTVASLPSQQPSQKDVEISQQPVLWLQPEQVRDVVAVGCLTVPPQAYPVKLSTGSSVTTLPEALSSPGIPSSPVNSSLLRADTVPPGSSVTTLPEAWSAPGIPSSSTNGSLLRADTMPPQACPVKLYTDSSVTTLPEALSSIGIPSSPANSSLQRADTDDLVQAWQQIPPQPLMVDGDMFSEWAEPLVAEQAAQLAVHDAVRMQDGAEHAPSLEQEPAVLACFADVNEADQQDPIHLPTPPVMVSTSVDQGPAEEGETWKPVEAEQDAVINPAAVTCTPLVVDMSSPSSGGEAKEWHIWRHGTYRRVSQQTHKEQHTISSAAQCSVSEYAPARNIASEVILSLPESDMPSDGPECDKGKGHEPQEWEPAKTSDVWSAGWEPLFQRESWSLVGACFAREPKFAEADNDSVCTDE